MRSRRRLPSLRSVSRKGAAMMNLDPVAMPKQNRTIKAAANPRFASPDKSTILIDLEFVELVHLGKIQFLACNNDPEDHGREIFGRAIEGEFGPIGDFVPPPDIAPLPPAIFVPSPRV